MNDMLGLFLLSVRATGRDRGLFRGVPPAELGAASSSFSHCPPLNTVWTKSSAIR
jgi:hypothetical protein